MFYWPSFCIQIFTERLQTSKGSYRDRKGGMRERMKFSKNGNLFHMWPVSNKRKMNQKNDLQFDLQILRSIP